MKILVETTGPFFLIDPHNGQMLHAGRPSVVSRTAFVSHRAGLGQVRVLATDLVAAATDAEFEAYWREQPEIAVAAFLSRFRVGAEPVEG